MRQPPGLAGGLHGNAAVPTWRFCEQTSVRGEEDLCVSLLTLALHPLSVLKTQSCDFSHPRACFCGHGEGLPASLRADSESHVDSTGSGGCHWLCLGPSPAHAGSCHRCLHFSACSFHCVRAHWGTVALGAWGGLEAEWGTAGVGTWLRDVGLGALKPGILPRTSSSPRRLNLATYWGTWLEDGSLLADLPSSPHPGIPNKLPHPNPCLRSCAVSGRRRQPVSSLTD